MISKEEISIIIKSLISLMSPLKLQLARLKATPIHLTTEVSLKWMKKNTEMETQRQTFWTRNTLNNILSFSGWLVTNL